MQNVLCLSESEMAVLIYNLPYYKHCVLQALSSIKRDLPQEKGSKLTPALVRVSYIMHLFDVGRGREWRVDADGGTSGRRSGEGP